jgi:hypothetical protein
MQCSSTVLEGRPLPSPRVALEPELAHLLGELGLVLVDRALAAAAASVSKPAAAASVSKPAAAPQCGMDEGRRPPPPAPPYGAVMWC